MSSACMDSGVPCAEEPFDLGVDLAAGLEPLFGVPFFADFGTALGTAIGVVSAPVSGASSGTSAS